jgi:hypothetical protein
MWRVTYTGQRGACKPTRHPRKQETLEAAQGACNRPGQGAQVFDRKGRLRFDYWHDGQFQWQEIKP